jgi:hypothetical protein
MFSNLATSLLILGKILILTTYNVILHISLAIVLETLKLTDSELS